MVAAIMSTLQHARITALAQELRLHTLPDLYGAVAQSAAKRKDASYADFLEEVLKGERDDHIDNEFAHHCDRRNGATRRPR